MPQPKLCITCEFVFDATQQLFLVLNVNYDGKKIPLSMAAYMQFMFEHESLFTEKEQRFCFTLIKCIKKWDHQGVLLYAIVNDYDMGLFFIKAHENDIALQWKYRDEIKAIHFNYPLPLTVTISQKGRGICCDLMNRHGWLEDPLWFLIFEVEGQRICFSRGYVNTNLQGDLELFLNRFCDEKQVVINDDHSVMLFFKNIYTRFKTHLLWKVQVDFLSLMPKETVPVPYLKLDYHHNVMTPTLCFQYDHEVIAPDYPDELVLDKKTGKKHQRLYDMEAIYQQDLMVLFNELKLPFMLDTPGDIARFLDKLAPKLESRGWKIESNMPDFKVLEDSVELTFNLNSSEKNWFYFEPNCDVLGQHMSLQEIGALMVQNNGYLKTKKGFVKLANKSQKQLKQLTSLGAFKVGSQFSVAEVLPMVAISQVKGYSKDAKELVHSIENWSCNSLKIGQDFEGKLRDYQSFGVNWMGFLAKSGLGGVLADDMGLGKTVQTLALTTQLEGTTPVLVLGPTNVIYNWKSEVKKFLPNKKVLVYAGASRKKSLKKLMSYDFVVTSFGVLKNDIDLFSGFQFKACFVDEAQYIKNPRTQISQAVKRVKTSFRLAMTGTPVENHLLDLWNLFDFVMPNYLGTQKKFEYEIGEGISDALKNKLKPFILRREKREVLDSLPEKTEIILKCPLTEQQQLLYQTILKATQEGIKNESGKNQRMHILTSLLKLRQVCTHPSLLKELQTKNIPSAKFELMTDKLKLLIEEKHKAVVFSQFTSMLDILQEWLDEHHIHYERIDGSVTGVARQAAVDRFQNSKEPTVFLLSLKAGGVGINLTAADYVFHMDPWWNPAVESQATDRVHRMGQTQKVVVYKCIAEGTIEEKIQQLQEEKKALLSQLVDVDNLTERTIDVEEIKSLLFD